MAQQREKLRGRKSKDVNRLSKKEETGNAQSKESEHSTPVCEISITKRSLRNSNEKVKLESPGQVLKTKQTSTRGNSVTKNVASSKKKQLKSMYAKSKSGEKGDKNDLNQRDDGDIDCGLESPQKKTVLLDWVIKPVPDRRGICVEGQILGQNDFWHSTAIVDSLKPNLVVTATGSLYQLEGKINKLLTIDYGISKDIAKSFASGFPKNWKDVIRDYYQDMEQSITVTQECLSPKKFQRLKTKQRSVLEKSKELPVDTHTILTPTGLLKKEMDTSELTMTRSGRVSLPPLAGWAGQYYVKMPGTNSVQVSFTTDCAKQALGRETMHALALSKRDKLMFCCNALSKNLLNNSPNTANPSSTTAAGKSNNHTSVSSKKSAFPSPSMQEASTPTGSVLDLHNLKSMTWFSGKENILDCSFQPQIRVVDCQRSNYNLSDDGSHKSPGQIRQSDWVSKMTNQLLDVNEKQSRGESASLVEKSINSLALSDTQKRSEVPKTKVLPKPRRGKQANVDKTSSRAFGEESEGSCANSEDLPSAKKGLAENLSSDPDPQSQSVTKSGKPLSQGQSVGADQSVASGTGADGRKQSRKRKRSSSGADRSHTMDEGNKKSKKPKSSGKSKRQKLEPEILTEENVWTEDEKNKFHSALRDVTGDEADYWRVVSQRVSTKSEDECQQFHRDFLEKKAQGKPKTAANNLQKAKSKKETGRQKGGPIRGGKGTLKRKQDLRNFLTEQNEGYEDDPFKGTPFVKMKRNPLVKDVSIDFNKEDSEIFGTNHNFFTPVAGKNSFDASGLRFQAKLASVRKTPSNEAALAFNATPMSVNERKYDIYIKNFLDKKSKPSAGKTVSSPPEELELSVLPIKSLFPATAPKIFVDNLLTEDQNDVDDDEDEDDEENNGNQFLYYWSDGD